MDRRCFYCKKVRGTRVRYCKRCRHYVCGYEDCSGSPCPKIRKRKAQQ